MTQNPIIVSENSRESITDFQSFENGMVDCFEENNTLWFRLSDIAKVLNADRGTATKWKEWADEDELVLRKVQHSKNLAPYGSESLLYRILNRTNSPKAKPFERWVTKVVIPSIRKTGSYTTISVHQDSPLEKARFLHEIAENYAETPVYMQILDAYAVKEITGKFVLPLPESTQQDYSATEVGNMLGISANKVGSIANKIGIKTEEFGRWCIDKSPYSSKEVRTFRYYMNAVEKLRKEINVTGAQK